MRLPERVGNPVLATLLAGSGIASREQFADLINQHAARRYDLYLTYDRGSVKRWIQGGDCHHPTVVADVLSQAWGIPIAAETIWPNSRGGAPPAPLHQHPWVADHTVAELAAMIRRDALTDPPTGEPLPADPSALVGPIRRWLAAEPGRLLGGLDADPCDAAYSTEVCTVAVTHLENVNRDLAAGAASIGGGAVRDAAIGYLRRGVGLLRYGRCPTAVGNQLLAVVADLAGTVAAISEDADRPGWAQAYALVGLRAAHESTDPRGPVVAAGILTGLATQRHTLTQPDVALALLDLANGQLSTTQPAHRAIRAVVAARRGSAFAALDPTQAAEVLNSLDLAIALTPSCDTNTGWLPTTVTAIAGGRSVHHAAAEAYLALAATADHDTAVTLAAQAHAAAVAAMAAVPAEHHRDRAYTHLLLASADLLLDDPDAARVARSRARCIAGQAIGSQALRRRLVHTAAERPPTGVAVH